MQEYHVDPFPEVVEEPTQLVTAVFSHPLHGRLVERLILWVRPHLDMEGERYKLTWWGNGVAYYEPVSR
ncbi:MAG: hypothetical protein HY790_00305 [Deltaproteobacteria bacterium]|nr:hypothetical protein [Deltaproteobacteria bacterium]MBI4794288.1 hypothetical protein [Deltaproteobacteria bacterium]